MKNILQFVRSRLARSGLRLFVLIFVCAFFTASAFADGSITYSGCYFVDNGYNGGSRGDGVQNGGETGYAPSGANQTFYWVLTNSSGGTSTGNANLSFTTAGCFTLSIANVPTGYSLTKLYSTSLDNAISQFYVITGGSAGAVSGGSAGAFSVANSGLGVVMTWATGAVPIGSTVSGGAIALTGNVTVSGFFFWNPTTNGSYQSGESRFTDFSVTLNATYYDEHVNQSTSVSVTTDANGAYAFTGVPHNANNHNIYVVVPRAQFDSNDCHCFINTIQGAPGDYEFGDENKYETSISPPSSYYDGSSDQTWTLSPAYKLALHDTWYNVQTVTNTNLNYGVLATPILYNVSSASQLVTPGEEATYYFRVTTTASSVHFNVTVSGGTNPSYAISSAQSSASVSCSSLSYTFDFNNIRNWEGSTSPGVTYCIKVIDRPTSTTADSLNVSVFNEFAIVNNPWSDCSGSSQTVVSAASYTTSGYVFTDDGLGSGTAFNGKKDGGETYYSGASMTASYVYKYSSIDALTGVSSTITSTKTVSATTDGSGAFSFTIPAGATSVVITRLAITDANGAATYTGTYGSGGSSTLKGTYKRYDSLYYDTVTISTLSANVSGVAFGVVKLNTLVAAQTQTAIAGSTIYYPQTYTVYAPGKVTFSVANTQSWGYSLLSDAACSRSYVSSSANPSIHSATYTGANTTSPITVCLLLAVTLPASASGSETETISASYAYTKSGSASSLTVVATVSDITTVGNGVSGTVYVDADHDSSMGASESGYAGGGLYIKLFKASATTAAAVATVSSSGTYTIAAPSSSGSYILCLSTDSTQSNASLDTAPSGYVITQNLAGYSLAYSSGNVTGVNFGLYYGSKVTGLVFTDNGDGTGGVAGDGIQNSSSEASLNGVAVTETPTAATACSTTACSTTTGTDGTFTLYVPGAQTTAVITRIATAGWIPISGYVGDTGGSWSASPEIISFSNASGTYYSNLRFGDVKLTITLVKSADKSNAAPGESITYTVTYANLSSSNYAPGALVITDNVPDNTTYVGSSATCALTANSGLTACSVSAPDDGGSGTLKFAFTGSLKAGYGGTVTFKVKIK